jgi:hypothetical protein
VISAISHPPKCGAGLGVKQAQRAGLRDGLSARSVFENDTRVRLGEVVHVAPQPGALRLFDAKTGAALRGM